MATTKKPIDAPCSLDAEMNVIGSLVLEASNDRKSIVTADAMRSIVSPEMFFGRPDHRAIFQAIIDTDDNGQTLTATNICQRLNGKPQIEWREDIREAVETADVLNAHQDAKIVHTLWQKREGMKLADRLQRAMSSPLPEVDAAALVEAFNEDFGKIVGRGRAELGLQPYSDIEVRELEWLVKDIFPLGMLSLCVGPGEGGKSTLFCSLAAAITWGNPWPSEMPRVPQGDVIIVSTEDDAEVTIKPRLMEVGADVKRVHRMEFTDDPDRQLVFTKDMNRIRKMLEANPAVKMIVFDPLSAYMGPINSWSDADVRTVLGPLSRLANDTGVAMIGICHVNKSEISTAVNRVLGSVAVLNAARSVWMVAQDKDDKDQRLFVRMKGNLCPPMDGFKFRLVNNPLNRIAHVEWGGRCDKTADEALTTKPSKKREAMKWLESFLAGGAQPVKEIKESATEAGITWGTLRQAQRELEIVITQTGQGHKFGKSLWSLKTRVPS